MTPVFEAALPALLAARTVAVVGVSRDPARLGSRILKNAVSNGFDGELYGIARETFQFEGARILHALDDIPGSIDVVLLAVPADGLAAAIEQIPPGKCRVAVAIASGFAEIGASGESLERELAALCRRKGIALIGPNCQGVVVPRRSLQLTFSPMYDGMQRGSIAIISQSGAMGGFMANRLMQRGSGISAFVSSGNESVLNIADYVDAFGRDPQTQVILAYLEQIRDGRRFCEAVRALPPGKSILVVKSGRGVAGTAAVRSHTGAIAGDDMIIDAVLSEVGAVRLRDSAAAVDAATLFAGRRRLAGKRIGVLSIAGGLAVETTDLLELGGLEVPRFDDATVDALKRIVPAFGATRNPVDLTGAVLTDETLFERALDIVASAPDLDGWVIISTFVRDPRIAEAIAALYRRSMKPLVVCWTGGEDQTPESLALLREAGVPVFDNPARAAAALTALYRGQAGSRRRVTKACTAQPTAEHRAARALVDEWRRCGRTRIHEADAKRWLAAGGIPVPGTPVAGGLAVVKICVDSHLHKTDHGLVKLGVPATDVAQTRQHLLLHAEELGLRAPEVLVEAFIADGLLEWLVGCRNDPTMGPVVVIGVGGIHAELFTSPTIGTAPLCAEDAMGLIRSHPAFPIIDGARGRPRGDTAGFANFVAEVANLFAACSDLIDELDLNPVIVRPSGTPGSVVALDAMLILAPQG